MKAIKKIISGGQTGVDRAALDVALEFSIPCCGWCPPGRACENGTIPDRYPLTETPQDRSPEAPDIPRSQRTEWNVRDADAVLILSPSSKDFDDGTRWTIRCAEKLNKNILMVDPYDMRSLEIIGRWLARMDGYICLNIAGPPESMYPGISDQTKIILVCIFKRFLLMPTDQFIP